MKSSFSFCLHCSSFCHGTEDGSGVETICASLESGDRLAPVRTIGVVTDSGDGFSLCAQFLRATPGLVLSCTLFMLNATSTNTFSLTASAEHEIILGVNEKLGLIYLAAANVDLGLQGRAR